MLTTLISNYFSTAPELWQGRKDTLENERFFQLTQCIDLNKQALKDYGDNGIAIIGFASDEGVKRNLGRSGASKGPDTIRHFLAALPAHKPMSIIDVGTVHCVNGELELAQKNLALIVEYCLENNYTPLVFGGGHEVAWGHYLGLKSSFPEVSVINFDAHFDLRGSDKPSSGTPFKQIALDKKSDGLPFPYCVLGIQPSANTQSLFTSAKELNTQYLLAQEMSVEKKAWQKAFLDDFLSQSQQIYLTLCLDVFSASVAPGVSAPQPAGLSPNQVFPLLNYIFETGKVVSVDIAELNPRYDIDNHTARLAAQLAFEVIHNLGRY